MVHAFMLGSPGGSACWPVDGSPVTLSITKSGSIVVTCYSSKMIKEYNPLGQVMVEIPLESPVLFPWQAIRTGDRYLVSLQGDRHMVWLVDNEGNRKKSYGIWPGLNMGQLEKPCHLAQDAKDSFLVLELGRVNRFTILNKDLEFLRCARPRTFADDGTCERFCVDSIRGQILVADRTRTRIDIMYLETQSDPNVWLHGIPLEKSSERMG